VGRCTFDLLRVRSATIDILHCLYLIFLVTMVKTSQGRVCNTLVEDYVESYQKKTKVGTYKLAQVHCKKLTSTA